MFERIIGNWRRVVAAEMRVAAVGVRHCRQRRRRWACHAPTLFVFVTDHDNVLLRVANRRDLQLRRSRNGRVGACGVDTLSSVSKTRFV